MPLFQDFAYSHPPSRAIRQKARAKVNLTLHIKGKRPDGYHELESLVVFAGVADDLILVPSDTDELEMSGPFASAVDGENLVLKAKRAVCDRLGLDLNARFLLNKNIPVAAGLGGGSSDAAAAIRAMFEYAGADAGGRALCAKAAASVGADVPVCLHGGAAWMRGLGERVTPISGLRPLPALLVNPGIKLATGDVFAQLDAAPLDPDGARDTAFPVDWQCARDAAAVLARHANHLEAAAKALEPAVGDVLAAVASLEGCVMSRLSGSGPTCFGLFDTQEMAQNAETRLKNTHPSWWAAATVFA